MARITKQSLITDICRLDSTANAKALKRLKLADLIGMAEALKRLNEPVEEKKRLDLLPVAELAPPLPVAEVAPAIIAMRPTVAIRRPADSVGILTALAMALVAMVETPLSLLF